MENTLYTRYDLIEVDGIDRMSCWLPSQTLKIGDRVTLKGYRLNKNPLTQELTKIWWQVTKAYPEYTKSKEEIEIIERNREKDS